MLNAKGKKMLNEQHKLFPIILSGPHEILIFIFINHIKMDRVIKNWSGNMFL